MAVLAVELTVFTALVVVEFTVVTASVVVELTVFTALVAVVLILSILVCVPAWPFYKRNLLKWLPHKEDKQKKE